MGLFSFRSSTPKSQSKSDRKAIVRQQYDAQIESAQRVIDNYKKAIADARWQLKMTKDKSHKRTIEDNQYRLKQAQEHIKQIRAAKAAALKSV